MRIAIDVSQLAFENTGVANYLLNLIEEIVEHKEHSFILFYSSLRRDIPESLRTIISKENVELKSYRLPLKLLDIMWNKLHIIPIEKFVGVVDFFISSDWVEPPAKRAKKATILYDLIIFKYPAETAKSIIEVQKRKLRWVKSETEIIFCISNATKKDAEEILKFDPDKLTVIYPGLTV